jgi:hypothetical protein
MIDLTKINTPFGDLDDATKGALLLAHHRGDVIELGDVCGRSIIKNPSFTNDRIYRVYAAPVIGTAKFHGVGPINHSLHPCAGEMDGYAISVTFPTRDGQHVPGVYTSAEGLQVVIEVAA